MKYRLFVLFVQLAILAIVVACGGSEEPVFSPPEAPAARDEQPTKEPEVPTEPEIAAEAEVPAGAIVAKADVVRPLVTTYDGGDSFAAGPDRIYVAEDDEGIIDVHRVSAGGERIEQYRGTPYDKGGDDIAVDDPYILIAEDNEGFVDIFQMSGGNLIRLPGFDTDFDVNDRLAAAMGYLYVAEDDNGIVDIYDIETGRWIDRFNTTFDRGDDVAAYNVLFLVAEDKEGDVQVYNQVHKWRVMGEFTTNYDVGDGLGAYMIDRGGTLMLVTCVAEDSDGRVECIEHPADRFFY